MLADIVETFDCEQGSDEWVQLRLGLPTTSVFGTIMRADDAKTRTTLLYKLAGEALSGQQAESYTSGAMNRGKRMEAAAREQYAFTRGVEVKQVGFVRRTIHNPLGDPLIVGCSPDGLVGDTGILEIKSLAPDLIVAMVENGKFPTEHRPQVQGSLWVIGRQWGDLKIYFEGMPISPTFRMERDEAYIRQIRDAVEKFSWDLAQLIKRVKRKSGIK